MIDEFFSSLPLSGYFSVYDFLGSSITTTRPQAVTARAKMKATCRASRPKIRLRYELRRTQPIPIGIGIAGLPLFASAMEGGGYEVDDPGLEGESIAANRTATSRA